MNGEIDRATALTLLGGKAEAVAEPKSVAPKRSSSDAGLDDEKHVDATSEPSPADAAEELDDLLQKAKENRMEPLLNLDHETYFL